MPTMSKLVSAVLMAALGWVVADLIVPHLPEEQPIGRFREIMAALGLLIGWRFLGRRAGHGYNAAIGFGLGASVLLVFWGLLVFSGVEMLRRSLRKAYHGPTEALKDQVQVAIDYFAYVKPFEVYAALILGGIVLGLIAEFVSRRWS